MLAHAPSGASGSDLERINLGYNWLVGCSLKIVIDVFRNYPFAGTALIERLMRHYWTDNINKKLDGHQK